MKKFKTISLIIACSGITFFSCGKKEKKPSEEQQVVTTDLKSGFPDNINSINGYFYASIQKYSYNTTYNFIAVAYLNDPATDIISAYDHYSDGQTFFSSKQPGNVSVGAVSFNGIVLNMANTGISVRYNSSGTYYFNEPPATASWKTAGNRSFKPFDMNIDRGFPVIINTYTNSNQSYSLSINGGYSVDLTNMVSKYDSLIVRISQGSGSKTIRKNVTPGSSSVYFSTNDLSGFYTGSAYLLIYAYNYSNRTIENVKYVFELSNKLQVSLQISP